MARRTLDGCQGGEAGEPHVRGPEPGDRWGQQRGQEPMVWGARVAHRAPR